MGSGIVHECGAVRAGKGIGIHRFDPCARGVLVEAGLEHLEEHHIDPRALLAELTARWASHLPMQTENAART